MTKGAVLYEFFNRFLPAYPSASVPEDAMFPYISYEYKVGDWESEDVELTVNVWYYTESEAIPNAKANEIAKAIKENQPLTVPCDGGRVWFKRATQITGVPDDTGPGVKLRVLNVTVQYLTHY